MLKAIEKIRPLDISVIATGHGPILRTDWKKYVDLSEQYARSTLPVRNLRGKMFWLPMFQLMAIQNRWPNILPKASKKLDHGNRG
jgi:hypothetical protein